MADSLFRLTLNTGFTAFCLLPTSFPLRYAPCALLYRSLRESAVRL